MRSGSPVGGRRTQGRALKQVYVLRRADGCNLAPPGRIGLETKSPAGLDLGVSGEVALHKMSITRIAGGRLEV